MKISTTFACLLCVTSTSLSQISITSNDLQGWWAIGKSWKLIENDSAYVSMNLGIASSSSQSWNAPSIVYRDTMLSDNVLLSATPYSTRFPSATHAQRTRYIEGNYTVTYYSYTRITTDSIVDLGSATRSQGSGRDTTTFQIYYHLVSLLPATLGRSVTRKDSTAVGQGVYYLQTSIRAFDAFGTIILPTGSYQALRLKETSISQTVIPGFPTTPDTSISFNWVTKEGYQMEADPANARQASGIVSIRYFSYTSIVTTPTGIASATPDVPLGVQLRQNYPNPFNPSTIIEYTLPIDETARLTVYDVLGAKVSTLVDGNQRAGLHQVTFDGSMLPSGIYFYRLTTSRSSVVGKMNLLK